MSNVYGELLMGLKLKSLGPVIFFPVAGVLLLLTIFLFFKRRQLLRKTGDSSFNNLLAAEITRANPLEGYVSSSRNNIVDRSSEMTDL